MVRGGVEVWHTPPPAYGYNREYTLPAPGLGGRKNLRKIILHPHEHNDPPLIKLA